jgi:hypothetical protein
MKSHNTPVKNLPQIFQKIDLPWGRVVAYRALAVTILALRSQTSRMVVVTSYGE